MRLSALLPALWLLLASAAALAQPADCNTPAAAAITRVPLPGHPFAAIPTADGCTIFVSLPPTQAGETNQLAVLTRGGGKVTLVRTIPASDHITGMALSPDGRTLAAADNLGVTLFDTAALIRGAKDVVLARAVDGPNSQAVYAAFSPNGRLLAISDEAGRTVTIYDFAAFSAGKPLKAIGKAPVALGPTGLAFSPDGKRLYIAVQMADGPGTECRPENGQGPGHAPGLLTVVDADRAATNPRGAVLAEIPAGCNPVRVALSPDGKRVYVSARGGDMVAMFDAATLLSARGRALLAVFKVGKSPVGLAADEKHVFVTNSDRFGGNQAQSVYAIDPNDPAHAKAIPAGGFPRELRVTADGKTLLITNFTTNELELVNLAAVL